ncbi:maleylpyruvate isomerase family mycothiol-dependent enzyme [Streptomyces sp. NPDC051907]|uniref:maleylpyruvate isomerase family mycothiol-dependent enzyme n=1 Tax=Streptomyces sp. NPDC051907 TaxID=3155284 RepID=UPI00341FF7A0
MSKPRRVEAYPAAATPWPQALEWTRRELELYLAEAGDPATWQLPTRCPPWSVSDLTVHLAATFQRFADQLAASRRGALDPPFAADELSAQNLRAVREFRGDPLRALQTQALRFLDAADAPDELMSHQFGPIPVGLQMMFGLNELAVHHDDAAAASGGSYRPAPEVVEALTRMYGAVFGLPEGGDPWERLLRATGRVPAGD